MEPETNCKSLSYQRKFWPPLHGCWQWLVSTGVGQVVEGSEGFLVLVGQEPGWPLPLVLVRPPLGFS